MLVKRLLLPALVALVFVLAACGDDREPVVEPTAAPADTVTPVAAAEAATPTAPPAPTQPPATRRAPLRPMHLLRRPQVLHNRAHSR